MYSRIEKRVAKNYKCFITTLQLQLQLLIRTLYASLRYMLCTRDSFRARLWKIEEAWFCQTRDAQVITLKMIICWEPSRSSSCTRLCSHSIGSPYQWVVLPRYRDMIHPRVAPSDNSIMIRLIVEINTGSARGATRTSACIHICIYAYILYIYYICTHAFMHMHICNDSDSSRRRLNTIWQ